MYPYSSCRENVIHGLGQSLFCRTAPELSRLSYWWPNARVAHSIPVAAHIRQIAAIPTVVLSIVCSLACKRRQGTAMILICRP